MTGNNESTEIFINPHLGTLNSRNQFELIKKKKQRNN